LNAKSPEARSEWAARQAYIALGVLVTAAAEIGVDICPMEGFDNNQFDQILGLADKNLQSAVIATVGFRRSGDILANAPKVRFAKNDIVIEVK
jgi:nitroreductase